MKPKWEIHWRHIHPLRIRDLGGYERIVKHIYSSKYNAIRAASRVFGEPGKSVNWWLVEV